MGVPGGSVFWTCPEGVGCYPVSSRSVLQSLRVVAVSVEVEVTFLEWIGLKEGVSVTGRVLSSAAALV